MSLPGSGFSFRGLKPGAYRLTGNLLGMDEKGEVEPLDVKIEGGKTERVTLKVK